MEFEVYNEMGSFHIKQVASYAYLVTGNNLSIILYKTTIWCCAEEVPRQIVEALGKMIEEHRMAISSK